nr:amidohydrolase [Paracoccaceae bacterium]
GREMVKDGMMERFGIQEVYGMHNWPGKPVGSFAIRSGPFFAAADLIEIEVKGKGAHAAKPQDGVDTTVVASHIVLALQSIVARNVDPVKQAVVSVTSFETDSTAFNVIPGGVRLKGTVRTHEPGVQDMIEANIRRIVENTAAAFGATATLRYERNYPVTVNAETETDYAIEAARAVAGDCDTDAPLVMGGEDFSFMLNARPGAYILVGNGDTAMVHHPAYNFNDEAIPAGCSFWAEIVERRMPAA